MRTNGRGGAAWMGEEQPRLSFAEDVRRYGFQGNHDLLPYGIGCAWLGRKELDAERMSIETAVLNRAYALGFRYFDTSAAYGDSEVVVGAFLSQNRRLREEVFVATKCPIPGEVSPKLAQSLVRVGLESSLKRLSTDYIDLMQIHDIYTLHQVLGQDGAIEALLHAKAEGLIRYIGIATRPLELLREAVDSKQVDTILTYSDFTPLDQSAEALIIHAEQCGLGVINGSPLSAGLLTGVDPRSANVSTWHAESVIRKAEAIHFYDYCSHKGVSVLAAALQFPLRLEGIHLTLTGPASEVELLAAAEALEESLDASFWPEWEVWKQSKKEGYDA